MVSRQLVSAGMIIPAVFLACACQNTREGLEKDAEQAAPKIERAAEQSAQAAREAGREIAAAAAPAAQAIKEGAGEAGQVLREGAAEIASGADAAQQAAQIKAALMADATIDSTTIDVEADADTMTVALNGHVRSAAEKSKAASIATAKAPAYRVQNNLEVRQ
jgi:osmotically-inducible protein OsmY